MSFEKTWSDDWQNRILERVRRRGFDSVTDYANHHAGVSLLALADELGPEDIAGAQIESLLVDEAVRSNTVPRLLRDLFVRQLRHRLPEGWRRPLDEAARYRVAAALAHWETELEDHLHKERTFEAGQRLLDADLPTGWLPEGPDDPVIISFVDRCFGRAPS